MTIAAACDVHLAIGSPLSSVRSLPSFLTGGKPAARRTRTDSCRPMDRGMVSGEAALDRFDFRIS
jgi:hypothetical protein